MKHIELESLDKRKILICSTEHYTAELSGILLDIVRTIWNSTQDKEELHMKTIVYTAYGRKFFELLMWIHENCRLHVSIDSKKVLRLACKDNRLDVAKWVLQTFEQASLDIDGNELFMMTCDTVFGYRYDIEFGIGIDLKDKFIATLNWIIATFQIQSSKIITGVLSICVVDQGYNWFSNLVVSTLEKYLSCLKSEDMTEIINKYIDQKKYVIVNWFLEKRCFCSFDKQMILNKSCADAEIETIKILSKYLSVLDMNQAMINACTPSHSRYYFRGSFDSKHESFKKDESVACLNLLWNEINKIDHDSIDIRTIVRTVCQEEEISNNVMTWILLNLPLDQIPINEVLITCCQQRKTNHVKYIVHEVDNEQLDIKELFVQACRVVPGDVMFEYDANFREMLYHQSNYVMLVEYVFQILMEKHSSLLLVVNDLFEKKKFELILYFLKAGYCRNINMKNLLNESCKYNYVRLVQWILGNVEHKELDIKSAFHEACKRQPHGFMCLFLMWHYIHDINMFEINTVLKTVTKSHPGISNSDSNDDLKTWLLYIKSINQRVCQSDNALGNLKKILAKSASKWWALTLSGLKRQ